MASGPRRLRLITGLTAACCVAFGCARGAADVTATWTLQPTEPSTKAATLVRLALTEDGSAPVKGASLRLEAHMSHPGMAPVVADLIERDGIYESRVQLTMAGPWVIVASGELADGRRIVKQTKVTAVEPSS